jgi:monoamine oxidase
LDADVIVIGAGAAGLTAAAGLARRSFRVILLEGRDRIGGRVLWTEASDGRESVELGAEFIHGKAPETTALLRRTGSSRVALDGEMWTRRPSGAVELDKTDFRASTDIFAPALDLKTDETVDRYLRRFEHDAPMAQKVELARAFVEGFDAADPSIASVIGIADELCSGVDYATHRPSRGYAPLIAELRKECIDAGVTVVLSAVVRRVRWQRGEVVIEAMSGAERRALRGRAAIVTVPVGVLRAQRDAVAFDPELPAGTREALDKIEMGHVMKVALRFRSRFWARVGEGRYRHASFFRVPAGKFPAYWTQQPLAGAAVIAWAGGTQATALAALSISALVATAFDEFSGLFGDPNAAREEFIDGVMHDWSSDPFARGAYSYIAVGGSGARAKLGAPIENTLYIAGEATSTDGQGGTVNGAIATGERAAREAAAALGAK